MSIGDRPKFDGLPAIRLDLTDVEAISDLRDEVIIRVWAGIMGPGAGLTTDVGMSYNGGTNTLSIGPCKFGFADSADPDKAGIIRHDATIAGTGTVNLDPIGNGSGTGWIFVKRGEAAADEENRAYWDSLSQTQKVAPTNTRIREYAQFVCHASKTGYSQSDGYYPVLYVSGWAGGSPGVVKVHYFESGQYSGEAYGILFQRENTVPGNIVHSSIGETAFNSFEFRGLAQLARMILCALNRYVDNTWTNSSTGQITAAGSVGWNSTPDRGFKQINDYIDGVIEARIKARINSEKKVVFYCSVDSDASPTFMTSNGRGIGGDVYLGDPTYTVSISDVSTGVTKITFPTAVLTDLVNVLTTPLGIGIIRPVVTSTTEVEIHQYDANGDPDYCDFSLCVVGSHSLDSENDFYLE